MREDTSRSRASNIAWLAAVMVASLVPLAGLARTPWLDEGFTLRWVEAAGFAAWRAAVHADLVPPAYPLLLTTWASAGTGLAWLRLCSVMCSIGTIALATRWVGATSRRPRIQVALLLGTSPFLLRYAVELRAYVLVGLASAWAGHAAWGLASRDDDRGRRVASLLSALLLACLAHYTAVLLVPAVIVLMLIAATTRRVARVPWLGIAGVCATWALIVVAAGAFGTVARQWWMPGLTPHLAWLTFGEVFGANGPVGMSPFVQTAWTALCAGLVAMFVLAEPAREWTAPLGAAVAYWGCLATISVLWQPVWWPRTLLPGVVLLFVALAVASAWLRTGRLRQAGLWLVLAVAVLGASRWVAGEGRRSIEPWGDVLARVSSDAPDATLVVMPDYAAAGLLDGGRSQRRSVVPLRLDGRGNGESLEAAMRAAGPRGLAVVVRIDLTVMAAPEAVSAVLAQVAQVRDAAPARVFLVTSPDISLVPGLRDTRVMVEHRVRELFGAPLERRDDGALSVLSFAPPR